MDWASLQSSLEVILESPVISKCNSLPQLVTARIKTCSELT